MSSLPDNRAEYIAGLNAAYGDWPAEEILDWVTDLFAGDIAFANSFGLEDVVIQHIILRKSTASVESFVLDTGRLPPETYDLIERWRVGTDYPFRLLSPKAELLEPFVQAHGPNSFYQSIELRKQCCAIRKLEPLSRALAGKKAWITGLRREQSSARARLEVFEADAKGRVKVNPLAAWTLDDVWTYIKDNKVPYNVLHDRGFPSVGCAPCTRAIEAHEDIRAGRWWWEAEQQRECGLHQNSLDKKPNELRQEERSDVR